MMITKDLLLELGCEEIPAGMLPGAISELHAIFEKHLTSNGLLSKTKLEVFGTPRRLAVLAPAILERQTDRTLEIPGPPRRISFDADGKPTRAAESFAEKSGVLVSDLSIINTPKGEYLAAHRLMKGRSSKEILEELIPRVVAEIAWPRSMYWESSDSIHFIRPIRWIVALLGGVKLRITIGDVTADRFTRGHRFLGKSAIALSGTRDYAVKLKSNFVMVRPEDRRRKIEAELRRLAASHGLKVREDQRLLDSVAYLNEYPTAVSGAFDPEYLALPEEILVTVMRDHQKYFALERKNGSLAPRFLAVINLDRDRSGAIAAGHERVLRARFADAQFFWDADQRCRLADYLPKLNAVTYQQKLGSYGSKVDRVRAVARWLAEQWFAGGMPQASVGAADRAAELSKCDLITEMVKEFPELQGTVGGLYANFQQEPEDVSWAIYDQYKPQGLDDDIPRNLVGQTLSLADRFDTIVGCFAVGLVPTGSSDPFGLRRAAIGVVKIILETELPLSLTLVVARAVRNLGVGIDVQPDTEKKVSDFILERTRYILKERGGFAYDEVNAALAAGADDLADVQRRVRALKLLRKSKNFEPLANSFKRIHKILEKAGPPSEWRLTAVDPALFVKDAERELHTQATALARETHVHKSAGRFRQALQGIASLRPAVDRFFAEVMVMADEADVRRNRLTLLSLLLSEFSTIADFSEIVTSE